nr:AAA family ATPase [Ruminococcus flavefaciens]
MIAIALSHKADFMILDEPTSGLDPVARDELLDILAEYIENENRSVLFSTHITSDVERIADYVTILHNGRVWVHGNKGRAQRKIRYPQRRRGGHLLCPARKMHRLPRLQKTASTHF